MLSVWMSLPVLQLYFHDREEAGRVGVGYEREEVIRVNDLVYFIVWARGEIGRAVLREDKVRVLRGGCRMCVVVV